MKKHAYLIIAHSNWEILRKLIALLDDEKNDFFIHIDKKSDIPYSISEITQKSKAIIIESQEVFWADYSMIEVELKLLASAKKENEYSYYHLLSGVDLPIKSKAVIYNFFENSSKNFIGIVPKEVYYSVRRVKYYHFLVGNNYYRKSKIIKAIDRLLEYAQRTIGVNRLKKSTAKIIDGWQWFSITNELCEYLLQNEKYIGKMFKYSISSDELVLQTMVYNSNFFSTLYDITDLKNGSMRYIDWQRGKPYVWGNDEGDFDTLMSSPYMFARKFDESQIWIVDKICNALTSK